MFFSTPVSKATRPIGLFIGIFCLFLNENGMAANAEPAYQEPSSITQAAESFVISQLPSENTLQHQVRVTPLDPRLKFERCATDLETTLPGRQTITSRATVLVRCPTQNWQVYVPVKILSVSPVVVSARAMRSDTVLQADDLNVVYKDVRQAQARIFDNVDELIGAKTIKPLNANAPISTAQICQVCKGDRVVLKAGKPGLSVVASGTALGNGTVGDTIQIRNSRSQRVINAVVSRVGEAVVTY
ncbi:flagellar basal body P-ring formation chaperone FlgA [Plesiomonas shigelloides]|uniref:flagellar basal body P-ring formation chaperone FlgA n=2 Tax=Plesiomonas shigelloides TaxID=703 RepID=UPI00387F2C91